RILSGLDSFRKITLDFSEVETVGQAFVDEVFRIWQYKHPKIDIVPQNVNENIAFMINRTLEGKRKI
ncbi:MAG: histidine kinase, partial [Candidatus Nealsonbacteria bacterium CG_4_10_14_0_2_um_filter_39_15]